MYAQVLNRRKAGPSFSFRHQGVNLYFCLPWAGACSSPVHIALFLSYLREGFRPVRREESGQNTKRDSKQTNICFQMSLLGRHNLTPPLPHSLARKSLSPEPKIILPVPFLLQRAHVVLAEHKRNLSLHFFSLFNRVNYEEVPCR